jgi:hypothetical protein
MCVCVCMCMCMCVGGEPSSGLMVCVMLLSEYISLFSIESLGDKKEVEGSGQDSMEVS